MNFDQPQFWIAVVEIIWIDILLSGDNAVIIGLACRSLPPEQRRWGIILGTGAAIGLRLLFAAIITTILTIPYLRVIGAVILLWIAVKLLFPEEEHGGHLDPADSLWKAVKTIVVADVVMSLDNVLAIAAAAKGSIGLLVFGLALSIPLIVAGSALVMKMIDRYPFLVWAGAALLGWIAGELVASDPAVATWFHTRWGSYAEEIAAFLGAIAVFLMAGIVRLVRKPVADKL